MRSTLPLFTTSTFVPSTCARRVSAFCGACDNLGQTREVCENEAQPGAARDRDLRAVDPVSDVDSPAWEPGEEEAVNHVTNIGFNPR